MATRLFIFIWLNGWVLNLALVGWLVWDQARKERRLPPLAEALKLLVGSFFSWPFTVPFGFWAFVLGGRPRRDPEAATDGRWPWPWWVTGLSLFLLLTMVGSWVASVAFPQLAR